MREPHRSPQASAATVALFQEDAEDTLQVEARSHQVLR
jgi:hypothetical protein